MSLMAFLYKPESDSKVTGVRICFCVHHIYVVVVVILIDIKIGLRSCPRVYPLVILL
jgi:hypothetical protein